MARQSYGLTIADTTLEHVKTSSESVIADVMNASGFAAAQTTFETALAVCVADGASPTQAHVTAANTAYTAFKATFGSAAPSNSDVILSINATNVVTKTVLHHALRRLERLILGSDFLAN